MYYFHVVPDDAGWLCRCGANALGRFDSAVEAFDIAETNARANEPSEVLYHSIHGTVTVIGRCPVEHERCDACEFDEVISAKQSTKTQRALAVGTEGL